MAESKAEVDLAGCCCAVVRILLVTDYVLLGQSASLRRECNNLLTLHFDLSCYFVVRSITCNWLYVQIFCSAWVKIGQLPEE